MERARTILAVAGLLAGLGAAWLMLGNEVRPGSAADVGLVLAIGWSFLASGLIAWRLRPDSPIGPAMVARGGSNSPLRRGLFGAAVLVTGPLQVAWLLAGGHHRSDVCAGCPVSALELVKATDLAAGIQLSQIAVGAAVGAVSIAVLLRRWTSASPPLRFAIAPVVWFGAASFAALIFAAVNTALEEPLGLAPQRLLDVTLAFVPVAFLVGVARTRLARSAVADLVADLGHAPGPDELRTALARAVRDPSLEIAYWLPADERFVDASGKPAPMPTRDDARMVTMVEREGRRIAALVHDPAVIEDESLVRAVAAAAGLQLENKRLQAELRSQLEEVRASRARIVEVTHEERRRIERNLHDGTQQRLVSIAMTLGLAEARVASDAGAARRLIAEARSDLSDALEELRDLSQGIHPGILTERGLGTAVDELALRMRLPVEVDVSLPERLPTQVETAAYYVISEALANVAKHAGASQARVHVGREDGQALIAISDDGRGGADARGGTGLRGLRDHVEALGGRFALESPAGAGTSIEVEIPCG